MCVYACVRDYTDLSKLAPFKQTCPGASKYCTLMQAPRIATLHAPQHPCCCHGMRGSTVHHTAATHILQPCHVWQHCASYCSNTLAAAMPCVASQCIMTAATHLLLPWGVWHHCASPCSNTPAAAAAAAAARPDWGLQQRCAIESTACCMLGC
eukprot:1160652-Pelagomonas_calceolata.AAC.9